MFEGSDFDYGEKEERTRSFRSNAKAEKEYPFYISLKVYREAVRALL